MAIPFLDTNILLRHLLQDHPEQSPKATAYLARIEGGEVRVRIAETVIFETVFTLQRQYGHPKAAIRDNVLPLIELSQASSCPASDAFAKYSTCTLTSISPSWTPTTPYS
jgi:predicted nucleic acid-binding protein